MGLNSAREFICISALYNPVSAARAFVSFVQKVSLANLSSGLVSNCFLQLVLRLDAKRMHKANFIGLYEMCIMVFYRLVRN
ncbi:hypothetical protein D3C72_1813420 [compost metagenome]